MRILPLRIIPVIIAATCASTVSGQDEADSFVVPDAIQSIMKSYCNSCHANDSAKGNVRFDMIEKLDPETRLELLNKAQE